MSGLDKIKAQILKDAQDAADAQMAEAAAQVKEINAQAEEETKIRLAQIAAQSEMKIKNIQERSVSAIDLKHRTRLLEVRQQLISETIEQAYTVISEMDAQAYAAVLKQLVAAHVWPQEGQIIFADADRARLPEGFEEDVLKIAEAAGGSLTVSDEKRNIENGFVLVYGGIEENCTLRSIFDEKKDQLSDLVRTTLGI